MDPAFWHERWEKNQLGFHQEGVNPVLVKQWPSLDIPAESPVFAPLCGKSLDLVWLRKRGHPVTGIEISPIAIRDFFAENGIEPTRKAMGELELFEGGGFSLYCGDFFALEKPQLEHAGASVAGCFDRASLIALPPEIRKRYAAKMASLLPEDTRTLLISLDYDQSRMNGPPHAVGSDEIHSLYDADFDIKELWTSGPQAPHERFRERGLDVWCETAYRLERRSMKRK